MVQCNPRLGLNEWKQKRSRVWFPARSKQTHNKFMLLRNYSSKSYGRNGPTRVVEFWDIKRGLFGNLNFEKKLEKPVSDPNCVKSSHSTETLGRFVNGFFSVPKTSGRIEPEKKFFLDLNESFLTFFTRPRWQKQVWKVMKVLCLGLSRSCWMRINAQHSPNILMEYTFLYFWTFF